MNPDTFPEEIALQTKVVDWSWIAMVCLAYVFQLTAGLGIFRCVRRHEAWKVAVIQGAQVLLEKEEVIGGYGTFAKCEKVEQDWAESSMSIKPCHMDYAIGLATLLCVIILAVDRNVHPVKKFTLRDSSVRMTSFRLD
ncbi:hypothetical protein V8E51_004035 [Hyaloscypha variabilis]